MEYCVEFTNRAIRDLADLYRNINAVESIPAARWYSRLEKSIQSLDHLPYRCPVAPESGRTGRRLRQLLFGRRPRVYRVLFEIHEQRQEVLVLAIRHWAMDVARPDQLD
jgi:plasmid stabilization system protein ParE